MLREDLLTVCATVVESDILSTSAVRLSVPHVNFSLKI